VFLFVFLFFFSVVLGMEPRALWILGKCSATDLPSQSFAFVIESHHCLCPDWPQAPDLPSSTSGIAEIIGISYATML
jgi:hypothetical protein